MALPKGPMRLPQGTSRSRLPRKQARKQREEFIAALRAHAPTLLGEAPIGAQSERWLRDTDAAWRGTSLAVSNRPAWKRPTRA